MSTRLSQLIDAFAGLRVLVIGEAILDSYLNGAARSLCREAPVPVVALSDRHDVPGGAATTAANVSRLSGEVAFLSVIGADPEASLLQRALVAQRVVPDHILTHPVRRTLAKSRVVAESQLLVRFDQGDTGPLDRHTEQGLIERLTDLFPRCDAVLVSDYRYGILTPRVVKTLARLQERSPRVIVVDSRALTAYRDVGVTAVKPNYLETLQLLGPRACKGTGSRVETLAGHGERILALTGAQIAAVTLDADGALIFEQGQVPYRTYARVVAHGQPAGAGDTFLSAFTLALTAGAQTTTAAELASAAAALVVEKEGTAVCTADELREYVSSAGKFITDRERLAVRVGSYRQQGRRIVFTNGCFDILHSGHVRYLNRAKTVSDVLIVGVNSDASVARLKGAGRPINTLEDRVQVLAALSGIDLLVAFDEDTPSELIRIIRPDVFVKGGDYTRATLPEAPLVEALGGTVQLLSYEENHSTTGVIERIRQTSTRAKHTRLVAQ